MLGEIADTALDLGKDNVFLNSASREMLDNLKRQIGTRFMT
jgi:hypothetical protein